MKKIQIDYISITAYTDGYPCSIAIDKNNYSLRIDHLELDNLIYALDKIRRHIKGKLPDRDKHEVL